MAFRAAGQTSSASPDTPAQAGAAVQAPRAHAGHRIAVIGCGTGGLAAATLLARDGHAVTLFERSADPRPLGAGLLLQPTGLACLDALGVGHGHAAGVRALGNRIDTIVGHTRDGSTPLDLRYGVLGAQVHGVAIHRGALFGLLLAAAQATGVVIRAGVAVVDAPTRAATTARGTAERVIVDAQGATHGAFDLVVDASGMRSQLRARCAEVRHLRANPWGALWCVVPMPADWPHPHALQQRYHRAAQMMGLLPIGRREADGPALVALFWSLRVGDHAAVIDAGLEAWQRAALDLWPEAAAMVAAVPDMQAFTFATYADIALRRPWADGLAFIGDAAHTASPQLGQGANLALLDATALATSLRLHAHRADGIGHALVDYAHARRDHVRFYSAASRLLTPFFQSESRIAPWLRDRFLGPFGRLPWVAGQMASTLAGVKTGLLGRVALPAA